MDDSPQLPAACFITRDDFLFLNFLPSLFFSGHVIPILYDLNGLFTTIRYIWIQVFLF